LKEDITINRISTPQKQYTDSVVDRIKNLIQIIPHAFQYIFLAIMGAGPRRLLHWYFKRQQAAGKTIWLDNFSFGRFNKKSKNDVALFPSPEQAADIKPDLSVKTRQSRIVQHEGYPEPKYAFDYRKPPLSGNITNGLGETANRRASKVFHTYDYATPWGGLEFFFHMFNSTASFKRVLQIVWDNRNRKGLVNPKKQQVEDAHSTTEKIKQIAIDAGAVLVGVTKVQDHHIYENEEVPYQFAISVAYTMHREEMLTVPYEPSVLAVMDAYVDVGRIALQVATQIRAMGWDARADTNISKGSASVLHVPIAIDAGLGQLGKHGSLITQTYGSNVRLTTILTNLPLVPDTPVDIGVDDFCANCQVCITNCPPHAIFDVKQMVRGEKRWYVNFDTCIPYFSSHGGCGICIEVCPWSEEGRGALITEKMFSRRGLGDIAPKLS